MKKRVFLTILFCLLIGVFSLFSGCNEINYSKDDINNLYLTIKSNEKTSQFFNDNTLQVVFLGISVDTPTDKNHIFPLVYQNYLTDSSSLMSGVIDRVGQISIAVKDFSVKQKNDIYLKLENLYKNLLEFSNNKSIFEISNGNLHYRNVLNSYNSVLNSLYSLNETFAKYYFVKNIGFVDFSSGSLSDSNVRDMLKYQILKVSKVSFLYELLNFEPENPLGSVLSWYDNTQILKSNIQLSQSAFFKLSNPENLASHIGAGNAPQVLDLFSNMQSQEFEYLQEYNFFIKGLKGFNLNEYFKSTNKTAFLRGCSDSENSCFQIMQNFLTGRYDGFCNGISAVLSYL